MTDISALESYAGQLSEAAQLSRGAAEKQHQYIHGDATTDVVTESGPVPTIAKQARLSMEQTAGLQLELASADDAAKGASLIGDKGTTVSAALELNLRKPRKVFSKLFAAASAISHLRVVIIGDSLAGAKMLQLNASLDRRMGGVNMSGVNSTGTGSGDGTPTGGFDLYINTSSLVTAETLQYQYWPTGLVSRLNDGASALWVRAGSSPTFTDVKVYYIKEPSAGTLNLSVGGNVVATVSAAADVTGLGVLSYTQAAATGAVLTTVSGGSVRILFVHTRNTSVSGLDVYQAMNRGGLLLADATASAQGRSIWQAALTDINPDFITFEMDDDFGDGAAADASFNYLVDILDTSSPYADKLFIGSTPRTLNDSLKMRSGHYLKGFCGNKGASYLFFDSYHLLGTHADMNTIFGTDDGTHPVAAAQAYAAEMLWEFLGLNGFNLGFVSRAVNDRGTPSRLARGTTIGDRPGREISITGDASSGSDFTLNMTRSFALASSTGVVLRRTSVNPGVVSNVEPMATDFDTPANVRKRNIVTASGIEITQLVKTDNPGGMQHLRAGLFFNSFTRAQLLALSAASQIGALAYCSDCTGGAQWVYAKGPASQDWVTVAGNTAI
ncbi:hypothetical protein [Pseudomonas grimontii]|uniref:hypothetical protein n=1 Tax=Pseudomonas grimontii TaxID=129847 RepID=UPI00387AD1B2